MNIDINKLLDVYGTSIDNWGDLPNFQGDYINYGYWKNIQLKDNERISVEQRVESSIALYKEVIKDLNINKGDVVLEIGCGRGKGIIDVLSYVPCKEIIAIDINQSQVNRTKANIQRIVQDDFITLITANAENTGLASGSIDKIYSVEAGQHFSSIDNFAIEMKRILSVNGRLAFATYYPKNRQCYEELKKLLPLIDEHLENITPVHEIQNSFLKAGFSSVDVVAVGEHTFYGYYRWVSQISTTPFSQNYYKAYKAGYIDYYIFNIM